MEIAKELNEVGQTGQCSRKLREALGLDGSPVAVAITSAPLEELGCLNHKVTPCMMIQMARRGQSFYCSGNQVLCGGKAHLGIGESPIRKLDDFLVRREKLFGSRSAARKFLERIKRRAPQRGSYLAWSPLERAHFAPQVVLFVGAPAQISRILFLNAFDTGDIEAIHGEPLCSGAIAGPMTTAKIGVSFLDVSCRIFGRYKPEEMVIGVPFARLPHIVENIDRSAAGTAKPALLLRVMGTVLRQGVPGSSR